MKPVATQKFFRWAKQRGVVPYPDDPDPPYSMIFDGPPTEDRFWVFERAAGIPFLLSHVLAGLDPWKSCFLWPRGGRWLGSGFKDDVGDGVRAKILAGAGVPVGFRGALRCSTRERDTVVTILFAQAVFGWSVPDDVFVVPDHGRQIVQVSHHDVVHVDFADRLRIGRFVRHMAAEEFALPTTLPDATFKRPRWMK
jgi:hypothetical protein